MNPKKLPEVAEEIPTKISREALSKYLWPLLISKEAKTRYNTFAMRFDPSTLIHLLSRVFPGPILYLDKNFRFQYVSDSVPEWLGKSAGEILGKTPIEVMELDAYQKREKFIQKAMKGERVKFVATLKHPKLGERVLEHTYEPDRDQSGNVRGILIFAYDLTEQKEAEKTALLNQARYQTLTEMMPQLIWETDAFGRVSWVNGNWLKATGTKLEANLNEGWLDVIHPDDQARVKIDWVNTLEGKSRTAVEYRIRMADGSFRWHISRASALRDRQNRISSWVGTTTDIHDQKNEEDKLHNLLMHAPMAIALFRGPDFLIDFMNPASISYSSDSTGKRLFDAYPELETQGFRKIMNSIFVTGKGIFLTDMPLSLKMTDGTFVHRYFDFFYEPLKDETGKVESILNIAIDVTDKRSALLKAEEALIARDQFLSMASHELKTPLTSLKLQAQFVMKSLEKHQVFSPEKQLSMAYQTDELVTRLSRLIDDMLDVSRIRTGKLRLEKSQCDLSEIVRGVVLRMSEQFEVSGLQLPTIEVKQNAVGAWDCFRLEQVVSNLLTNAIRYGQGHPVKVEISVKGQEAFLTVEDHGVGIAAENLDRIFDLYERIEMSHALSGLGLGLFISKQIVTAHRGRIWVESEIGKGSKFFVALPLMSAIDHS